MVGSCIFPITGAGRCYSMHTSSAEQPFLRLTGGEGFLISLTLDNSLFLNLIEVFFFKENLNFLFYIHKPFFFFTSGNKSMVLCRAWASQHIIRCCGREECRKGMDGNDDLPLQKAAHFFPGIRMSPPLFFFLHNKPLIGKECFEEHFLQNLLGKKPAYFGDSKFS